MDNLKIAVTVLEIIVAVIALLVIGDYIGYKVGRMRLAYASLFTFLGLVVVFAIYAAIVLI